MTESQADALAIDQERAEGDKEYRDELRHRCQTDGFFLAPLIGFDDFTEEIHGPVRDLYVHKKPGLGIAEQDTEKKKRGHIDPRGTFKTSYGVVDDVQWVVTCPDITIAKVTGTMPLGIKLTQRTGRIFVCPKNRRPSVFQSLFPEFVVRKIYNSYRAPCTKRDEVEPTLYSTSIGSNQTGDHPWIINPDDMVTPENSGIDASDDSRDQVWNTWATNLNTLRPGGYVHLRNTRYHPFDTIGRILQTMDESEWLWLIRSSLTVRSGARLVEGEFPKEDEIELHFPEMLPYKKLRTLFREDYRTFMCQQQNDPQGGGVSLFPPEVYKQMLIHEDRVPTTGDVRCCWRLQSDAKGTMKHYAYGVIARFFGAKIYIVEAWRGAYTPTELCERVVAGCKRNDCGDLTIENTPGSESMIPHIYQEALRRNWSLRIERPEFEPDDAVRQGRMATLQPMARAGRLWISTDSTQGEELKKQFTSFGMIEENGLVDAISRIALRIPVSTFKGHVSAEQRAMHREAMEHGMYEQIYGQGGAVEVEKAVQEYREERMPSRNHYGMRPMLGGLDGRY